MDNFVFGLCCVGRLGCGWAGSLSGGCLWCSFCFLNAWRMVCVVVDRGLFCGLGVLLVAISVVCCWLVGCAGSAVVSCVGIEVVVMLCVVGGDSVLLIRGCGSCMGVHLSMMALMVAVVGSWYLCLCASKSSV